MRAAPDRLLLEGLDSVRPALQATTANARVSLFATSLFPLYRIEIGSISIAAKLMNDSAMAEAEARGLNTLRASGARVPEVFGVHSSKGHAILYMEFLSPGKRTSKDDLLSSLRCLYAKRHESYGLEYHNFIGSLSQPNQVYTDFGSFFFNTRIEPRFRNAMQQGLLNESHLRRAQKILERLCADWKLDDCGPRLVHGDLWSGNVLSAPGGVYLIDPSIARSHPEQDFGMLLMFGGPLSLEDLANFGESIGLPPGLEERIPFWQLYPLLVHVNIFGAGYVSGVERVLRTYD